MTTLFRDAVTGIIARVPTAPAVNVWVYLEVFGFYTWLFIVSVGIVLALFFFWVENILRKADLTDHSSNGFVVLFLLLLQLGTPYTFNSKGTRVLFMASSFFTIVVFAYYTAEITTSMTVIPAPTPIRNFEDVAKSAYDIRYFKNAAPHNVMQYAGEKSSLKVLYDVKVKNYQGASQPLTYSEAEDMMEVTGNPTRDQLFPVIYIFISEGQQHHDN